MAFATCPFHNAAMTSNSARRNLYYSIICQILPDAGRLAGVQAWPAADSRVARGAVRAVFEPADPHERKTARDSVA